MNLQNSTFVELSDGSIREVVLLGSEGHDITYYALHSENAGAETLYVRVQEDGPNSQITAYKKLGSLPASAGRGVVTYQGEQFERIRSEQLFSSPITGREEEEALNFHTYRDRKGKELVVQESEIGTGAYMVAVVMDWFQEINSMLLR